MVSVSIWACEEMNNTTTLLLMHMYIGLESDQDNDGEGCIGGQKSAWQNIGPGIEALAYLLKAGVGIGSVEA